VQNGPREGANHALDASESHPEDRERRPSNLRRMSREGMRSPKPQIAVAADACLRPSPEDDKGGSGSHQVGGFTGLTRSASGRSDLPFPVDGYPSDLWLQLFLDVNCIALWIGSEKILTRLYLVLHWFNKRLEVNIKNSRENLCFQIAIVLSLGSFDNSTKCAVLWKITARLITVSTSVNNEMWVKLSSLRGGCRMKSLGRCSGRLPRWMARREPRRADDEW